jgi:hypothetical protein
MAMTAIANQVRKNQDKDGMLRRALERIIQLYTDKSHFVYELLQNAEDAGATEIKFEQFKDHLTVLHNGHPFTKKNLQGLCDIGRSDKTNDLNQIGEFGVGFKSVFGICDTVRLYSHPNNVQEKKGYPHFAVEIQDFTRPVDISDDYIEAGYTTKFVFPYKVGCTFSGFSSIDQLNRAISKRLQNLGITTLLFMKNLQSIEYSIDTLGLKTSGVYLLERKAINDHCALVSAIGEAGRRTKENEEISYLVFSRPVAGIQAGRTIDIAFAVSVDNNGQYQFQPSKTPYISVYFPTETESKLKFIVQGPYRTTPNRSSVPADNDDNIGLAKQTSALLRDSIIELRDSGKLDFSLLNILPIDREVFDNSPLFDCMYLEMEDMMRREKILPCKDGSYAASNSVKIARGSELADVLTDDLLTELLDDGTSYHWLPTFLTETNRQFKTVYEFLTGKLKIEVIRPENLGNAINKNNNFLLNRNEGWLVKFYQMYENVPAAFARQKSGSNMLTADIVKTSKGNFIAPYRKCVGGEQSKSSANSNKHITYLPNVFLPSKDANVAGITYVDKNIYNKCRTFFDEILHLQFPNEYEFFIRDFKRRYQISVFVPDDQYLSDLKRLLDYYGDSKYQEEVKTLMHQFLKLKCFKDGQTAFVSPYKEKIFFPVTPDGMNIEQYYAHVESYAYVDEEYYAKAEITRKTLSSFGISDDISIGADETCGEYHTGNQGRQPEWHTDSNFRWKLSLDHLDNVLQYISLHPQEADSKEKSSFIFHFLLNHENMLQGTVYIGGSTPDIKNAYSEIVSELRSGKTKYFGYKWDGRWLFNQSGDLVYQKDISKYDLNVQLYGEVRENSKLYDILGFAKNQEEKRIEAEQELDRLSEETKDRFFETELYRRYGIKIADLEKSLGSSQSNEYSESYSSGNNFEFPSSKVRNWDSLRKHAAEVLVYANPVKYQSKVRRIRVSRSDPDIKAYLRSMYLVEGSHKYACQMCHQRVSGFENCQISTDMDTELDPMYLCLCPNCASKYRRIKFERFKIQNFLNEIRKLTDQEISQSDPVKINIGDESIWFTQTHVAEVRELMKLKEETDDYREPESEMAQKPNEEPSETKKSDSAQFKQSAQQVKKIDFNRAAFKEYIGKRVEHKKFGRGVVKSCDGSTIEIIFDEGPKAGQEVSCNLKICLDKHFLRTINKSN